MSIEMKARDWVERMVADAQEMQKEAKGGEAVSNEEKLREAIEIFQRERGFHEGEHVFCCNNGRCFKCEEAYVHAEAKLDAALAAPASEPPRCKHCGWPIVPEGEAGCWESNCSMRPMPPLREPPAAQPDEAVSVCEEHYDCGACSAYLDYVKRQVRESATRELKSFWPKDIGHCNKCNRDINCNTHALNLWAPQDGIICIVDSSALRTAYAAGKAAQKDGK